jgi:hypothetical protein
MSNAQAEFNRLQDMTLDDLKRRIYELLPRLESIGCKVTATLEIETQDGAQRREVLQLYPTKEGDEPQPQLIAQVIDFGSAGRRVRTEYPY